MCARLQQFLEWARSAGLGAPAERFFRKLSCTLHLLATPRAQLIQVGGHQGLSAEKGVLDPRVTAYKASQGGLASAPGKLPLYLGNSWSCLAPQLSTPTPGWIIPWVLWAVYGLCGGRMICVLHWAQSNQTDPESESEGRWEERESSAHSGYCQEPGWSEASRSWSTPSPKPSQKLSLIPTLMKN